MGCQWSVMGFALDRIHHCPGFSPSARFSLKHPWVFIRLRGPGPVLRDVAIPSFAGMCGNFGLRQSEFPGAHWTLYGVS